MELHEQLQTTTSHITSALNFVNQGNALSDEAAHELTRLIQRAEQLRDASIRQDFSNGYSNKQLALKYVMASNDTWRIVNESATEAVGSIQQPKERLLELAPLAITDVRGERILETMRQKIAAGVRPGITVIGPHVTIRFSGTNSRHMQSVTMQVTSIVDTEVVDEEE